MNSGFLIIICGIIFLMPILQGFSIVRLGIIEPNLALIFLIIFGFFMREWYFKLLITAISALSFFLIINLDIDLLFWVVASILALFILHKLPWYPFINILTAIILGTLILDFLIGFYIDQFNFYIIFLELIYNLSMGAFIFGFIYFFIGYNIYEKIQRD